MTPLHALANAAGLLIDWEDASGTPQRVSDDALRRVLGALGLPAETDRDTARSLAHCREENDACAFVSADRGQGFTLPAACGAADMAELEFEDGSSQALSLTQTDASFRVAGIDRVGYHRLHLGAATVRIAIAPERCYGVEDAAPGRRLWGPSVQVPALRDERSLAFGDFGTLGANVRSFAAAGADAMAISPAHALFPADASRFSPYAPSSRLFLNLLFGDPALVDYPPASAAAGALIDWEHAIPARIAQLREAFAARRELVADRVAAYGVNAGEELWHHAVYDALHTHFFEHGATGWQDWPHEFHDPTGPAAARFAAEHEEEVAFFLFAQWLARISLEAAQTAALDAGMAIGLISDLAVGMDPGGSHAWSRRGDLLNGLTIGAPPDLLGPDGQNWGITGFSPSALRHTGFAPFIATLRAGLDHAGGIRIDHALGLRRMWVIPDGATSSEGAYLSFPLEDMLRILAIESHRARAIVIGEDLGTVPEGLRPRLEARHVLGMQVLWFERDDDGSYLPPDRWRTQAVAMTGTHDLPTVAGWWQGRDIDWTWRLGRRSQHDVEAEERAARATERKRLWAALEASDAATGKQPDPDQPALAIDAAIDYVGRTPCPLALVPLEDLAGLTEQPNLPGTIDEHPNWRRRMPASSAELLGRPDIAGRVERLNRSRR